MDTQSVAVFCLVDEMLKAILPIAGDGNMRAWT